MSAAGANTDVPHETGCVHLFEVGNLGIATIASPYRLQARSLTRARGLASQLSRIS